MAYLIEHYLLTVLIFIIANSKLVSVLIAQHEHQLGNDEYQYRQQIVLYEIQCPLLHNDCISFNFL